MCFGLRTGWALLGPLLILAASIGCQRSEDRASAEPDTPPAVPAQIAHDFSTPQGAMLMLEDAFRDQDIEAAVRAKSFRRQAALMIQDQFPDSVGDEDTLSQSAGAAEESFRGYIRKHGYPDYDGVSCVFVAEVPYADNIVMITQECTFSDDEISTQHTLVEKTTDGWRVLNQVESRNPPE